ncbi:glutathione S-transferase 2-like isoform X2 [Magnolia sinica]|uniref:glutathione S-transferase 2-like isoform X2 n=1 Tax=Magnolia sinica TaxID=86752 RepID=UPI00265876FE|nr:glutathione S-transferase 2-like isoform X2 [Magnolia sinica]
MASVSRANSSGSKLQLYSYFRSSCAWRVRIALNLKGLDYEYKAVNLLKGEQFSPEFSKLNALNYVPVLVDEDIVIADSLAIILYLEEKYPQNPLLPKDLHKKAINFQAANIVCANIQPFQNLAVLNYIEEKINTNEKLVWAQYHIGKGFAALEKLLKDFSGKYATGDEVFLSEFPLLSKLHEAYEKLPAFCAAIPDVQPDAVKP